MDITLDQARALVAFAQYGSFAGAAQSLGKAHSGVVYALGNLEEQCGLQLLDRSGYRTKLTQAGSRVLVECEKLVAQEQRLVEVCTQISTGWEPYLGIVFDGVFPAQPILETVGDIVRSQAPVRMAVHAAFLSGVEQTFVEQRAHLMISVLPPQSQVLESVPLSPVKAHLVAHRSHELVKMAKPKKGKAAPLSVEQLRKHVLLTVRGSDPRLELSTARIEAESTVHLNDFGAKKAAIMSGVGFGWMPDYLIGPELKRGALVPVSWDQANEHTFKPRLYYRDSQDMGLAAKQVVAKLRSF